MSPVMPEATLMGFDWGERWTGVSIGDTATGMAHPIATLDARQAPGPLAAIDALVREWRPDGFVVGLPVRDDGSEHPLAPAVRSFGDEIGRVHARPVHYVDERLTSAAAAGVLRAAGRGGRAGKHLTHSLSAQHILQDWLDAHAAQR
jgi:putative Holliday junction resolvase